MKPRGFEQETLGMPVRREADANPTMKPRGFEQYDTTGAVVGESPANPTMKPRGFEQPRAGNRRRRATGEPDDEAARL